MTLIEELKQRRGAYEPAPFESYPDEFDVGVMRGIDIAVEIVEKHSHWIPASEPPKENGEYLTTIKDSMGEIQMFVMAYENHCWRIFFGDKVLAWLSIPKPYEGEGK